MGGAADDEDEEEMAMLDVVLGTALELDEDEMTEPVNAADEAGGSLAASGGEKLSS